MLNEIHGNGVPWLLWDGKLFEQPIGMVVWCFGPSTESTRLDVRLDECPEARPSILAPY